MNQQKDNLSYGLKGLALIWPIGLLIFYMLKSSKPKASKEALQQSLIGFGIFLVILIILSILKT